jgi:hypothetical protein
VINIDSRISPQIFEKIQKGSNGRLGGLGATYSWKKPEVENLVSDSLKEIISNFKTCSVNILLNASMVFFLSVKNYLQISFPFLKGMREEMKTEVQLAQKELLLLRV